jgi:hypothetical protein
MLRLLLLLLRCCRHPLQLLLLAAAAAAAVAAAAAGQAARPKAASCQLLGPLPWMPWYHPHGAKLHACAAGA